MLEEPNNELNQEVHYSDDYTEDLDGIESLASSVNSVGAQQPNVDQGNMTVNML